MIKISIIFFHFFLDGLFEKTCLESFEAAFSVVCLFVNTYLLAAEDTIFGVSLIAEFARVDYNLADEPEILFTNLLSDMIAFTTFYTLS